MFECKIRHCLPPVSVFARAGEVRDVNLDHGRGEEKLLVKLLTHANGHRLMVLRPEPPPLLLFTSFLRSYFNFNPLKNGRILLMGRIASVNNCSFGHLWCWKLDAAHPDSSAQPEEGWLWGGFCFQRQHQRPPGHISSFAGPTTSHERVMLGWSTFPFF